jgi:hypothetical protein
VEVELVFDDDKLKEGMAGWQAHFAEFAGIPAVDNDGFAVGIIFDFVDSPLELVELGAIRTTPVSPLDAVDTT